MSEPRSIIQSVHNAEASAANLARVVLSGIDARRPDTSIPTATLVLLLNTLIELAEPKTNQEAKENASRTVRSFVAAVATAERDRDEDRYQERGGDPPPRRTWG